MGRVLREALETLNGRSKGGWFWVFEKKARSPFCQPASERKATVAGQTGAVGTYQVYTCILIPPDRSLHLHANTPGPQ